MTLTEMLKDELSQGRFWTDAWSLVEGCTPVSPGCANCWLAAIEHRFGRHQDRDCLVNSKGVFTGDIRLRDDRLDVPLRARKPRVYAIWSDLFHEGVSPDFVMRALSVMALTPRHRYVIVTKRPGRAADLLSGPKEMWRDILSYKAGQWFGDEAECTAHNIIEGVVASEYSLGWPLSNVTILVTMEDQQRADERAPYALQLAGMGWRVGALCEPLLGPVDLNRIYQEGKTAGGGTLGSWTSALDGKLPDIWGDGPDIEGNPRLSWVITGGESGHGVRPANPDWVRSLRDQSKASGVPFMFKQWGDGKIPTREHCDHLLQAGYKPSAKKHGRTLDGREWLEVPE